MTTVFEKKMYGVNTVRRIILFAVSAAWAFITVYHFTNGDFLHVAADLLGGAILLSLWNSTKTRNKTMSGPPMIQLESSNIDKIGYDAERKALRVQFKSGGVYDYEDVEPDVFTAFAKAESPGKFFYKEVRNKYEFSKLNPKPSNDDADG